MVRPERTYSIASSVVECGGLECGGQRVPLNHTINRTTVEYTGCAPTPGCGRTPEYGPFRVTDWTPFIEVQDSKARVPKPTLRYMGRGKQGIWGIRTAHLLEQW